MDLHNQIMNIRTTSAHIGKAIEAGMDCDNDWKSRLALVYKMGHRDAKHAAAELVTIQQATDTILSKIEKLRQRLKESEAEKKASISPGTLGWICPRCGRGNAPSSSSCPCVPLPIPVVTY